MQLVSADDRIHSNAVEQGTYSALTCTTCRGGFLTYSGSKIGYGGQNSRRFLAFDIAEVKRHATLLQIFVL